MIEQPSLPYKKDALQPVISEQTMSLHYDKHHKGYIDNINTLIKNTHYQDMDIEQLVKSVPEGSMFNNAGQTYNHNMFWKCMSPESNEGDISQQLQRMIEYKFDNLQTFKQRFQEVGSKLFGVGWVWAVIDHSNNDQLAIKQFKNADTPMRYKQYTPVLPCDVWEHAFYLDYHNDKSKYLEQFWKVVNWEQVSKNVEQ